MGSRFFRKAGDSDSDTESSDEESLTSGDEATKAAAPAKPKSRPHRSEGSSDSDSSSEEESDSSGDGKETGPKGIPKFLMAGSDDEESDEEVKRVVKSAKDKRLEDMETAGTAINNALKINDWTAISAGRWDVPIGLCRRIITQPPEFDKLLRMIQRQQNVGEPIPPFFILTTTELETSVNDAQSKDAKKKMNATNARALTAMKQKVKKTLKDFEKEVKQYQAVRCSTDATFRFCLDLLFARIPKPSSVSTLRRLLQRSLSRSRPVNPRASLMKMMKTSTPWARVEGLYSLPLKTSSRSYNTFKRPEERR